MHWSRLSLLAGGRRTALDISKTLQSRRLGSSVLLQQQMPRQSYPSRYEQSSDLTSEVDEAAPDMASNYGAPQNVAAQNAASRFIRPNAPRANPISGNVSTIDARPCTNPFPEEVSLDYGNPGLFPGAASEPLGREAIEVLQAELNQEEVEIKPDGALYLPEFRYRKILFRAFGAGGWALVPRGAHSLSPSGVLSREYALLCNGRFVSQARGHATIQGFSNPALASEVVRSNALMRVCKDLGVGNELWDPTYCNSWRDAHAVRRQDAAGRSRWGKKMMREYQ